MDKRNSENFIMLPTVDFCFKELMQNPKVRQGFIAAIMGKDPKAIRKTTLIPNTTKKESKDAKLGILDVMVEMEDGSKINMEMQVAYFGCWSSRVLFYVSKTYSGQIKEGEDYDVLKKCIHVSILDFIHFPQDKKCYRKIAFCDVETGEQYTDLMELHILELKKLPPGDQNEEGVKQGIEQGIKQGKAQGERSVLQKLIRKKKEKGMSLAMIAELLEMTLKEVEELDNEILEEE